MDKQTLEKKKVFNKGWCLPLLIIVIGVLGYINTFNSPFVFDDESNIERNPNIRYLWPFNKRPAQVTLSGRPIVSLTLSMNYAISKYSVWSYHVVNIAIHLLGGLVLYGIIRRTFLSERLRERFGKHSAALAWVIATIWVVHPIQTESVTYIIQRAESLMGLFYLLTLYAFIRAANSQRSVIWYVICVICCGLGMMTKEVMVTAPVLVLLYDRAFMAGSFAAALRRRWSLYAGLTGTWGVLGIMLWTRPVLFMEFDFTPNIGTLDYALNQFIVIIHYLRLCVWPSKLCLYYNWPVVKDFVRILPSILLVLIMVGTTVWGLVRNYIWAFLSAWFFGILALTSSFIALKNLVFEHRLYLSLAGLVALVVTAGYILLVKLSKKLYKGREIAAVVIGSILAIAVIAALTLATINRNNDYHSSISIWQQTIDVAPNNYGAYTNLGNAFRAEGNIDEAVKQYHKALEIEPDHALILYNLALALSKNNPEEAIFHYRKALQIKPDYIEACFYLGVLLQLQDKPNEAIDCYRRVLQIDPNLVLANNNLAWILATHPKPSVRNEKQAIEFAERAAKLTNYQNAGVLDTLAAAQAAVGQFDLALKTAQKAIELASTAKNDESVATISKRMRVYQQKKPYRESAQR